MGQKYFPTKKRVRIDDHTQQNLQINLYYVTASLNFVKAHENLRKFHRLNFNESSLLYCGPLNEGYVCIRSFIIT